VRINVIGNSGCGKTTLGRNLAFMLGCPFHELDDLHWGPEWTPRPTEELRARVGATVNEPAWVIDGNYAQQVRDLVWPRTQLVVWLDFSLARCVWQLLKRTARRSAHKERLWSAGNTENLRETVFSRDSLLLWAIKDHGPRRRDNFRCLSLPNAPDYHRICSPAERDLWFRQFRHEWGFEG
jgi:adenylate kinase family enzyme